MVRALEQQTRQSHETRITRLEHGVARVTDDRVAIEEPLEIRLDFAEDGARREKSVSITMRTPGHDHELAAGFLFGEGILRRADDVAGIQGCGPATGPHRGQNIVKVRLADGASVSWPKLERHFYATSSCGVCGKASLDALEVEGVTAIARDGFAINTDVITELPARLRERQGVFDQTGGLHAAALFDSGGRLIDIREDVGRHNAVDKLIGARFLRGEVPLARHLLFLSGRASFELVQKAVVAGVPVIAAVGAPSSLAVELARRFDATLLGFVREGRFNIYHGAWRIQ